MNTIYIFGGLGILIGSGLLIIFRVNQESGFFQLFILSAFLIGIGFILGGFFL